MSATGLLIGIGIWFLAGVGLSVRARREMGAGVREYFLAGRRLGGILSALSYSATTYSAFMMVGLVGLTYKGGIAALGFELTYLAATVLLLSIFAPRYWAAGRLYDLMSPAEWLSLRYGSPAVGAATALLCLVMLIPYASVQLMGIGYLLETLSGGTLPYAAGMGIVAAVALVYAWWAGLRSVALTDALQAAIMLAATLLLALRLGDLLPGGWSGALAARPDLLTVNWPLPMFLGLTLPWAFFALTNPQVVQRLYAPRDLPSLRRTLFVFAAFGLFYTLFCVLLGLGAAALIPGLPNPDGAMPHLLTRVPPLLALVVTLSILAAAVSTLNAILLTLSSLFGRDLLRALRGVGEERELAWGKALLPLLTLLCLAFGALRPGLIAILSTFSSAGLMVQLPAVLGSFFWRRGTAPGVLAGMAAGVAVMGLLTALGLKPLGQWPPLWGLLADGLVFLGVSLLTAPPESGPRIQEEVRRSVEALFWPAQKPPSSASASVSASTGQ
jgi:SSS family solute:Na+ symporter